MTIEQTSLKTPIGTMYLAASPQGLTYLGWGQLSPTTKRSGGASYKILQSAVAQLKEYFSGSRTDFSIPLDFQKGTPFQRRVWQELQNIPFGSTLSYSDIAERIARPKACRAVGSANGKNPISIIVPCHRVIASSGRIAGYGGGVDNKAFLLTLEGASHVILD